ncbi:Carrier protein YMC1, mitochondrial, partial [Lachnellula willkommii]
MADIAAEIEEGGLKRTLKDLFAGAAGGIAQVLLGEFVLLLVLVNCVFCFAFVPELWNLKDDRVTWIQEWEGEQVLSFLCKGSCYCVLEMRRGGQPFDIVKVRLQTTTQYPSALAAARTIYAQEGALAFYKGTLTPLIGIGACVSVQFGAFHEARRRFEARNATLNPLNAGLSYGQYYAAGAFAGIANSVISGPIEHVRIRLQTQPHGAGRLYSGPLDCVRKLSAHEGVLRGLYRGEAVTVLREAQAYGMWFLAFEYMMNADAARNRVERKEIPSWKIAFYGGLAGEALWLGSYPFDVVKSKMQ